MAHFLISLLTTLYPQPSSLGGGIVFEVQCINGGRVLGVASSLAELDRKLEALGARTDFRNWDGVPITRADAERTEREILGDSATFERDSQPGYDS